MEPKTSICLYFQAHQPYRVRRYRFFDIGNERRYFDDDSETNLNNRRIMRKVAEKCYVPATAILQQALDRHPEFRASFSFSGVFLDQLEAFAPDALEAFQRLVATGRVEVLSETYHHSLSFLYSLDEFREQVALHRARVREFFGAEPTTFRNTELIYNNALAKEIEAEGYRAILAEGADHVLGWRSPNFVYRPQSAKSLKLLLKNYRFSDDIAFRFSSRDWSEYPLSVGKFVQWLGAAALDGAETVNLFMDYETFGEHQWADTGIFEFLAALPGEVAKNPRLCFGTPAEVAARCESVAELDVTTPISWADIERDLSAWRSNPMQWDALQKVYDLESTVRASGDEDIMRDWRRLQTSDHFYYMCTKWWSDGDVHKYFNPYESPYDAYIAFTNVLHDLRMRLTPCRENSLAAPHVGVLHLQEAQ